MHATSTTAYENTPTHARLCPRYGNDFTMKTMRIRHPRKKDRNWNYLLIFVLFCRPLAAIPTCTTNLQALRRWAGKGREKRSINICSTHTTSQILPTAHKKTRHFMNAILDKTIFTIPRIDSDISSCKLWWLDFFKFQRLLQRPHKHSTFFPNRT